MVLPPRNRYQGTEAYLHPKQDDITPIRSRSGEYVAASGSTSISGERLASEPLPAQPETYRIASRPEDVASPLERITEPGHIRNAPALPVEPIHSESATNQSQPEIAPNQGLEYLADENEPAELQQRSYVDVETPVEAPIETLALSQKKTASNNSGENTRQPKFQISLPEIIPTNYESLRPGKKYQVRQGDTLQSIAKRQLKNAERWPEIYYLNKDFLGRSAAKQTRLKVEAWLVLPADGG